MAIQLRRQAAVELYGCCRQAERSLDNALSCPKKWTQFTSYYDVEKRLRIQSMLALLNGNDATSPASARHDDGFIATCLAIATSMVRYLANTVKSSWRFSEGEAAMIAGCLKQLLLILDESEPPSSQTFIGLRMAFFNCECIVRQKLIGIPELRKAKNIEHFDQSSYVDHFSFSDLESESGAEPSKSVTT